MAVIFIAMVFDYPFFTVFISALIDHGITNGVVGGQLLSLFTLVGIFVSAGFGFLFKHLRFKVLPLACLMCALGMLLIFVGIGLLESLPLVIIAVVILAAGHMAITVGAPHHVSISCTQAVASAALAYTAVAMNLGGFVSSPYVQAVASFSGTGDYEPCSSSALLRWRYLHSSLMPWREKRGVNSYVELWEHGGCPVCRNAF